MATTFLERHPETKMVGNALVMEALQTKDKTAYDAIQARLVRAEPEWGKVITQAVNGVTVKIYPVNHNTPEWPYKTCAFLFDIGGIRMLHLGDSQAESNAEYFGSFALENESIDIAFVDPGLLRSRAGQAVVAQHIKPRAVILMHVPAEDVEGYVRELGPTTPNLHAFREPMERQFFAK